MFAVIHHTVLQIAVNMDPLRFLWKWTLVWYNYIFKKIDQIGDIHIGVIIHVSPFMDFQTIKPFHTKK